MLMRMGTVDTVGLLRHDIDPAPLIAAREAGVGASAGHMVEHRYIFGHADRIVGRQHYTQLTHAQPFGLHPDVQIEQHGVVRNLETLDVKVMLGEADRVVAEDVGEFGLLADLGAAI